MLASGSDERARSPSAQRTPTHGAAVVRAPCNEAHWSRFLAAVLARVTPFGNEVARRACAGIVAARSPHATLRHVLLRGTRGARVRHLAKVREEVAMRVGRGAPTRVALRELHREALARWTDRGRRVELGWTGALTVGAGVATVADGSVATLVALGTELSRSTEQPGSGACCGGGARTRPVSDPWRPGSARDEIS